MIEEGVANLCLVLSRTATTNLEPGFAPLRKYLSTVSPVLAERLDGTVPLSDKPLAVVCPTGAYFHGGQMTGETAVYRVGDRLAHIPPFTGDGIGIALCSATLAAEHIRQGHPASSYSAAARRAIAPTLRLAGTMSWLADSGIGRTMLTAAAARVPMFLQTVAQWTRVA